MSLANCLQKDQKEPLASTALVSTKIATFEENAIKSTETKDEMKGGDEEAHEEKDEKR
jgi:hypothetical protein